MIVLALLLKLLSSFSALTLDHDSLQTPHIDVNPHVAPCTGGGCK